MFLLCEHEYRKDQFRRQHRLNKHTLRQTSARTQSRAHIELRREQHADEETRKNAACDLGSQQQERADRTERFAQQHGERDGGVEQAARDAEEDPHVDHEREGEDEGDVE